MFTGIIEEIGTVTAAPAGKLAIAASQALTGLERGGSIAVNGSCLTVTDFDSNSFSVDVMPETLKRTNLGRLKTGDSVNLERPVTLGGQLGGHLVQGHVDDTGRVASVTWDGEAMLLRCEAPLEVMRFTVPKGFIAVDGMSLTITDKDDSSFWVSIVEYTQKHTTLGSKQVSDSVNLEVDIIAKYVEQLSQPRSTGITADFLAEHGFLVK
ncbi:riboflavin synthase [Chloroflexota bacterium]